MERKSSRYTHIANWTSTEAPLHKAHAYAGEEQEERAT